MAKQTGYQVGLKLFLPVSANDPQAMAAAATAVGKLTTKDGLKEACGLDIEIEEVKSEFVSRREKEAPKTAAI